MEVTEETAAKTENMQYYHIAPPDLGRDISPGPGNEFDEDDDDDPNWLMTSTTRKSSLRRNDSGTNVIVRQTCSADSAGAPPPRNGSNRLSRLLEGVTTAIIGPMEGEDADVIVGECAAGRAPPLPAYYQDDPIAARICELFDEMEPLEKMFAENNNLDEDEVELGEAHPVKMRPKAAKVGGGGGIFGRKKQTVSGYFSDWTKWLRGPESAARGGAAVNEGSGRSAGSAAKCNGRE